MHRNVLPIPNVPPIGLTTFDAKDPDTKFPPIRPVRPPTGAPNVLIAAGVFTRRTESRSTATTFSDCRRRMWKAQVKFLRVSIRYAWSSHTTAAALPRGARYLCSSTERKPARAALSKRSHLLLERSPWTWDMKLDRQ